MFIWIMGRGGRGIFFDPDCHADGTEVDGDDELLPEFFVLRRGKNVPSGPIECC